MSLVRAAETRLADHHYVSALDIFIGVGCSVPFIRHRYTRYDELRMSGTNRAWARQEVQPWIEEMLDTWRRLLESASSSGAQGSVSERGTDEVGLER